VAVTPRLEQLVALQLRRCRAAGVEHDARRAVVLEVAAAVLLDHPCGAKRHPQLLELRRALRGARDRRPRTDVDDVPGDIAEDAVDARLDHARRVHLRPLHNEQARIDGDELLDACLRDRLPQERGLLELERHGCVAPQVEARFVLERLLEQPGLRRLQLVPALLGVALVDAHHRDPHRLRHQLHRARDRGDLELLRAQHRPRRRHPRPRRRDQRRRLEHAHLTVALPGRDDHVSGLRERTSTKNTRSRGISIDSASSKLIVLSCRLEQLRPQQHVHAAPAADEHALERDLGRRTGRGVQAVQPDETLAAERVEDPAEPARRVHSTPPTKPGSSSVGGS
jgi:hypothetical protein